MFSESQQNLMKKLFFDSNQKESVTGLHWCWFQLKQQHVGQLCVPRVTLHMCNDMWPLQSIQFQSECKHQ